MKEKIKVKIGMVDLGNGSPLYYSTTTKKVLILEEYDTECLVLWGNTIKKTGVFQIYPNGDLIDTNRIYNIKEREISKFRLWCYKYWNSNF